MRSTRSFSGSRNPLARPLFASSWPISESRSIALRIVQPTVSSVHYQTHDDTYFIYTHSRGRELSASNCERTGKWKSDTCNDKGCLPRALPQTAPCGENHP